MATALAGIPPLYEIIIINRTLKTSKDLENLIPVMKAIKDLVNSFINLNVTTKDVNKRKGLAIKAFKKDMKESNGLAPCLKKHKNNCKDRLLRRINREIKNLATRDIIPELTRMDDRGSGHILVFKVILESVIKAIEDLLNLIAVITDIDGLANALINLNVTTQDVNKRKGSAIKAFLDDLKKDPNSVKDGLAPYLEKHFNGPDEERLQHRIAANIQVAAQDIVHELTKMDDYGSGHTFAFKENLESVIKDMKLERC